jgi:hypothetical protein
MLLYCSQSFLEMLEGEPAQLAATYERITADGRHTNLRLLMNIDISERVFPDWTMGFERREHCSAAPTRRSTRPRRAVATVPSPTRDDWRSALPCRRRSSMAWRRASSSSTTSRSSPSASAGSGGWRH